MEKDFRIRLVLESLRLVPKQPEPRAAIERDCRAMRDMILGEAPEFGWIVGLFGRADAVVDRARA